MLLTTSLLGLIRVAAAVHVLSSPGDNSGTKLKNYTSDFDNLKIGIGKQLHNYHALNFKGFEVYAPNATKKTGGLAAQTKPNVALARFQDLNNNTPALVPAGNTSSFDLKSFYFGCERCQESTPMDEATTCAVILYGTSSSNDQISLIKSFAFNTQATYAKMTKAVMPQNWSGVGIDSIVLQFGVSGDGTPDPTKCLMTDGFEYAAYMPK